MSIFRNVSIRKKLFLGSLIAMGSAVLAAGAASVADDLVRFRRLAADNIAAQAGVVGRNSAAAMIFNDTDAARENLEALKVVPDVVHAAIYGKDGVLFAWYSRDPSKRNAPAAMPGKEGLIFGAGGVTLLKPIVFDGEGIGYIYMESDMGDFYDYAVKHVGATFVIMAAAFFLAIFIFEKVNRSITGPINGLSYLVEKVAETKNYGLRAEVKGRDEVGVLAFGFNAMLEEIQKRDEELETKVKKRTAALENTLEEMKSYDKKMEEAYEKLKNSEKTLIESAKMASLGEMGAGVAHELNSPIAGILSITEVLMKRTKEKNPEYYHLLEKIGDAAVRSKFIVQDVLTYSRPASAEGARAMKPVYLNEALKSTFSLFSSELKKSSIEIKEELKGDLPPVMGDKGRLMEVFLNIMKNARDAMQDAGVMTVRTKTMREDGKEFAVVEVEDTGPGVPEEIKDMIFDPFFTTKEKGGGLNVGLGLSICRGIVDMHGGKITFESRRGHDALHKGHDALHRGHGAVFRIMLPVLKEG